MRFEVRCPALWSEIDTFEEPTYEEVVKIVKGVGYCNSPNSAERLRNFGYIIKDLYLEKEELKAEKKAEKLKAKAEAKLKAEADAKRKSKDKTSKGKSKKV